MTEAEIEEIPFKQKKKKYFFFNHRGAEALDQIDKRSCAVFILKDIQGPTRHGPEQPAVAYLALSRGSY